MDKIWANRIFENDRRLRMGSFKSHVVGSAWTQHFATNHGPSDDDWGRGLVLAAERTGDATEDVIYDTSQINQPIPGACLKVGCVAHTNSLSH